MMPAASTLPRPAVPGPGLVLGMELVLEPGLVLELVLELGPGLVLEPALGLGLALVPRSRQLPSRSP